MIGAKKGLFGKSQGFEGINLPAVEQPLPNDITFTPQAQAMRDDPSFAAQPKQGFDWKKALINVWGGAADAAAQHFGMAPTFGQNQQMQQMMAMRQAEEQRQRAAELADYRTKLGFQQEFETPKVNDTIADFQWFKNLSAEDRALYEQMRPVYRAGPDGQFYRVDTAPQQPQQGAPAELPADFFNPNKGGGVSGGPGGFRR